MKKWTDAQKVECGLDALRAHGNTNKCLEWLRKYWPEVLESGVTTVQYSLSCSIMDRAKQLIECDGLKTDIFEYMKMRKLKYGLGPND